jgi:hypothetical protein
VGDELAARGVADRDGDGELDAELVRPVGLCDALDFRRVQGIPLANKTPPDHLGTSKRWHERLHNRP